MIVALLALAGCSTTPKQNDWNDPEFQALRLQQAQAAYDSGNAKLAVYLLEPLAEKGNAEAQYTLGYLNYYGQGVERDQGKAVNWFRQAAGGGSKKALDALTAIASGGGQAPALPASAPADSAQ
jgi:TPR repeat protein